MRCSCCGNEIREDERYCSRCGQNNEYYVETKQIEKVEIYSRPTSNPPVYPQPQVNQQTNAAQQINTQGEKQESAALGVCAIIFSVLGGWLGLLLSIIGLCTYKTPSHRTKCKIGLGFCIGWAVIDVLWLIIVLSSI